MTTSYVAAAACIGDVGCLGRWSRGNDLFLETAFVYSLLEGELQHCMGINAVGIIHEYHAVELLPQSTVEVTSRM